MGGDRPQKVEGNSFVKQGSRLRRANIYRPLSFAANRKIAANILIVQYIIYYIIDTLYYRVQQKIILTFKYKKKK